MQVPEPRIVYRPRPGAAPEAEREALAAVYRFVFDCHERKKEACGSHPDDQKGLKNDPATTNHSR